MGKFRLAGIRVPGRRVAGVAAAAALVVAASLGMMAGTAYAAPTPTPPTPPAPTAPVFTALWAWLFLGERIALETRGDVFVTRTEKKGLIRRITENSLARTKFPAISPDGKSIAAWTEVDGEEQVAHRSGSTASSTSGCSRR